ncbi:MAG TPA: ABC transporter ATP-binding protein [Acidimicrobiales bacterium]|nr:ABC transporter ATP-binding protein [Acidimicrobiales bacterium]
MTANVLDVHDLRTYIQLRKRVVRAVDGVSLSIASGETLGLVGESGCGKTMTAASVMRLLPPGGHIVGGSVRLNGVELSGMSDAEIRNVRGNDIGMIFQDPMTSLNPTMTIGRQIAESVVLHKQVSKKQGLDRAAEVLSLVGMPSPSERLNDYPHQLSGGLRQRVMIAMALACEPKLLIADEPTTALDVTIQAQILTLLDDLRARLGMAILLITHDMGVIAGHTDRTMVMYAGQVIEMASTEQLFGDVHHPYTEALLASIPQMDHDKSQRLYAIPGLPPDLSRPLAACRFHPRCRYATEECRTDEPPLAGGDPQHPYACFHPVSRAADEIAGAGDVIEQAGTLPLVVAQALAATTSGTVPGSAAAIADLPAAAVAEVDGPWPAPAGPPAFGLPPSGTGAQLGAGRLRPPPSGPPPSGPSPSGLPTSGLGPAPHARDGFAATVAGASASSRPEPATDGRVVLELRGVRKDYPVTAGAVIQRRIGTIQAVRGVDLALREGETLGVVGESGCGKSTLGRMIVGLENPTRGSVLFEGTDLTNLSGPELRRAHRDLALMFQDPYSSLDPRMRVGTIIREPLVVQGIGDSESRHERVSALLREVGLPPHAVELYPHEFSGGQRQRIGLARALALNPRLIVADEPVSALDVSIRSQILNLMKRLQAAHSLAYVFISHDLSVVRYLADRIAVMYLGKLVEIGSGQDIYSRPAHPYTAGLIGSIPVPNPVVQRSRPKIPITGELPSPLNPPSGCPFRTRCPNAQADCAANEPSLTPFDDGHLAACYHPMRPSLVPAGETPSAA